MAVSDPFSRDVRASKSPRNAFRIGYSSLFSSPCGLILPCYVEEVDKGDKLKLGLNNVTRTRPVNTSAFMTFDEKVDFWFVPYHLLWSDYTNWRLSQTFRHRTTELANAGKQYLLPHCRYADIAGWFKSKTSTQADPREPYFLPNPSDASRLLDLLGYSIPRANGILNNLDWTSIYKNTTSSPNVSDGTVKGFVDYYNNIDSVLPVNYFRLAAYQCVYMHGYRNEEYEKLDPTFYNCDNVFTNLNFSNTYTSSDNSQPAYSTPRRLAVSGSSPGSPMDDRISLDKLFTPRYKNWRADVFTTLKPTSGFEAAVSGLQFDSGNYNQFTGTDFSWPTGSISGARGYGGIDEFNNPATPNVISDPLSVNSIRYYSSNPASVYQALSASVDIQTGIGSAILYPQTIRNLMSQDKFVRSSIYAKKNLSSQFKALFGENYEDPHTPKYLGSYSTNIQISDVMATATGSDGEGSEEGTSYLGEIAGKGLNTSDNNNIFEREFDCDGIVIGMHYVMPRNNYDSYRISRMNTKVSRWDYFYPQFDGLGMQPVFQFERSVPKYNNTVGLENCNTLLGFAPRFFEYKQRTNEVHGVFMSGQSESNWTLSNNSSEVTSGSLFQNFKILPTISNRIFSKEYHGSQFDDPFFHYYFFDVVRISNKEVYGTPSI